MEKEIISDSHNRIAERFVKMCASLDSIKDSYTRTVPRNQSEKKYPPIKEGEPYLVTQLRFWVKCFKLSRVPTRTGKKHSIMVKAGRRDNRKTLPSTIVSFLAEANTDWKPEKVEVKWIVCYLSNIKPDNRISRWEYFECSHRCIEYGLSNEHTCISSRCFVWESKSINQSRGNAWCCSLCKHEECQLCVCVCQKFHNPPCI